jgi:copper chaperone CopZ
MVNTRIYCPDIECDSCIKLIDRKLRNHQGISVMKFTKDHVDITYDDK